MDRLKTVRVVANLYYDHLEHYLILQEDLKKPRSPAEWNKLCNDVKEIKRIWVDPLQIMLHRLGVSAVKEENDLIIVKFDDGTTCGWKRGWV